VTPEGIFEADTRLVFADNDGTFDDCGLHWLALMQQISHGEESSTRLVMLFQSKRLIHVNVGSIRQTFMKFRSIRPREKAMADFRLRWHT
jgi:hypothetical protein